MKNIICALGMTFGIACGASATGTAKTITTKPKITETKTKKTAESKAAEAKKVALVEQRANHLSDQMIRELRLNNYQANKIREINLDVTAKIADIEEQFNGDQQLIDQKCKAVLAARDLAFEDILSTVQYNDYFGDRKMYSKSDKEFMASLNGEGSENLASNEKAAENATAGNASAASNAASVN